MKQTFAHVALVHVIDIPKLGVGAILEIAKNEDTGPAVQHVLHVADIEPLAIIICANLISHAKILFQEPLHFIDCEK